MLYRDVYLDVNTNYNFKPFHPPYRANRKVVKVRSYASKYKLSFMFIGNGYLKLTVSREIVFIKPYSANSPTGVIWDFRQELDKHAQSL